ncbi:MAG: acetyl-CoA carboxylase biotin carboxyl carrier protein subunit [Ruminococcaceae bacterium]|jgi:glutaconyl-CoA decarboxylase|nr:acetyl-CoA carboxylase biotin carboxyl carrier protein subunit [Oscillospiraceae bacterium]
MKYNVTLNGKIYEVDVTESDAVVTGVTQVPVAVAAPAVAPVAVAPVAAPEAPAEAPAAAPAVAPVSADGTQVKAPMPGTILAVKKNVGEAVKAGDVIVVLEAMKMENDIVAPCDGTVKSINAPKGSTVNTDDVIAVI